LAEEEVKYSGMEETLFKLLKDGGTAGMEPENLLVLLSLVNLMGIVNIIGHRAGIKGADYQSAEGGTEGVRSKEPESRSGSKGPPFDPSALLGILAGKEGAGANPGQLADLFNRFMTPPSGKPPGTAGDQIMDKDKVGGAVPAARGKP